MHLLAANDGLRDSLGSIGVWLVGVGLVLFVIGVLGSIFGVATITAADEDQAGGVVGRIVGAFIDLLKDSFKIVINPGPEPWPRRLAAGGMVLMQLGLLSLIAGLLAGLGGGGSNTPTPTPSST